MQVASFLVSIAELWGMLGLAVAALFLTVGIDRLDEDARGAYFFRALILPGVVLIWPVVLLRWIVLETGRDQWPLRHRPPRLSHKYAAIALAVFIPATIFTGVLIKQTWPADIAPVLLEAAK
ncbi:MAG: hypothetical protein ACPGGK_16105 [Pikeienuella sp.]